MFTYLKIMPIYGISNLHISRMELHIAILVEPVFSPLSTFEPSKYTNCVLDMSIPQSDNTFLVLSIIASDQNKMTLKIKTKWLWIFVKITYIYSDNFFPCSRGHFICKQNNILSMTSTFNYEFFEVGIQK